MEREHEASAATAAAATAAAASSRRLAEDSARGEHRLLSEQHAALGRELSALGAGAALSERLAERALQQARSVAAMRDRAHARAEDLFALKRSMGAWRYLVMQSWASRTQGEIVGRVKSTTSELRSSSICFMAMALRSTVQRWKAGRVAAAWKAWVCAVPDAKFRRAMKRADDLDQELLRVRLGGGGDRAAAPAADALRCSAPATGTPVEVQAQVRALQAQVRTLQAQVVLYQTQLRASEQAATDGVNAESRCAAECRASLCCLSVLLSASPAVCCHALTPCLFPPAPQA